MLVVLPKNAAVAGGAVRGVGRITYISTITATKIDPAGPAAAAVAATTATTTTATGTITRKINR